MGQLAIRLTGTTPLAMHNIQLADKTNHFAKAIAEITAKRKKTDADELEIAHLEFLGGLYFDPEVGVYVPTFAVMRCFEEAAKVTRQGKAFVRATAVTTDKAPLVYEGPRKPEDLWARPESQWRAMVGVNMKRVARMRPVFRTWGVTLEVELLETILDPDDFTRIAESAGRSEGLLDGRKLGYGRFAAEVRVVGGGPK